MEAFLESKVRARAKEMTKEASAIFESVRVTASVERPADIFLSHSSQDRELIDGMAVTLHDYGYSVYIDWRDDPQLDRSRVNKATATTLRNRMNSCKCLFYVSTENAGQSRWMPWELGYKDGQNGRVAIVNVRKQGSHFPGIEYLTIYPNVQEWPLQGGDKDLLWIFDDAGNYVQFEAWLKGSNPRNMP